MGVQDKILKAGQLARQNIVAARIGEGLEDWIPILIADAKTVDDLQKAVADNALHDIDRIAKSINFERLPIKRNTTNQTITQIKARRNELKKIIAEMQEKRLEKVGGNDDLKTQ